MPAWHGQPQKTRYAFTVSGIASTFGGVANDPPVWQNVPNITFFVGITSTFPISGTYQSNSYVTDANFDTIVITKNNVFVQGVTWDGGKFTSNGTGSQTTVTGHILTADDGHNSNVESPAFHIAIIPGAVSWTSVPSVSFLEGSTTPYNLGQNILNYNAATDSFAVTPGYTLPSWLSLSGTGNVNLTPNGNQLDADDFDDTPGIKIRVTRSGGTPVDSTAFGVTVNPTSSFDVWVTDVKRIQTYIDATYWNGVAGMNTSAYAVPTANTKNFRYARRAFNGWWYVFRADFQPSTGMPSPGPDEMYELAGVNAYNPITGGWELAYPWTGYAGDEQPIGADSGNYVWDSYRDCAWLTPATNPFGVTGSTWPGPSTWRSPSSGLFKFDYTGTRWRWQRHKTLAEITLNGFTLNGCNTGFYDPNTDSIYCLGSLGDRMLRLHLQTMAVYSVGFTLTDSGVPINSATTDPSWAKPIILSEYPTYAVFDPTTRKAYLLDYFSTGAYFGGRSSEARKAGVVWEVNLSGVPETANANAPTRVLYSLPERYRRPVYESPGNDAFENSNYFPAGYDLHIELMPTQRKLFVALPPQVNPFNSINTGMIFLPAETGYTPGTETPSMMIDLDTGVAVDGPPFNPSAAYYNSSQRTHGGMMFVDDTTPVPRVTLGWKSGSGVNSYQEHRAYTYPSWRPTAENTLTVIDNVSGNTLYSTSPLAVQDVNFYQRDRISGVAGGWNSAVFNPYVGIHGAFILSSGGDADYWGNEVYVYTLDDQTWRRYGPYGPGPSSDVLQITGNLTTDTSGGTPAYNQTYGEMNGGQPLPPHTYDAMALLPPSMGGGTDGSIIWTHKQFCYGSVSSGMAHRWDVAANTANGTGWNTGSTGWQRAASTTDGPNGEGAIAVVDEDNLTIWSLPNGDQQSITSLKKMVFNPSTGIATTTSVATSSTHFGLRTWPVGEFWKGLYGQDRYLVVVGPTAYPTSSAAVRIYDLSQTPIVKYDITVTGDVPTLGLGSGFCYCPDLNASTGGCFFVKSTVGGTLVATTAQKIWRLDPPSSAPLTNAWTFTQYTMGGATQIEEGSNTPEYFWSNGLYKRGLRYSRSARCILSSIASSSSGRMYAWVPPGLL